VQRVSQGGQEHRPEVSRRGGSGGAVRGSFAHRSLLQHRREKAHSSRRSSFVHTACVTPFAPCSHCSATIPSFAISLATNLTAEQGVDEWILRYSALVEFDAEATWFRPLAVTLAKSLLGSVAWGTQLRLTTGAGLNMLDMASDINVIVLYLRADTNGVQIYGQMLLGFICFSMLVQLLVISSQYAKCTKRRIFLESFYVISGLKPGVDGERSDLF